jgi:hypothetical protein
VDHVCSLLSPGDLSRLGVSSAPTQGMIGTSHTCEADTAADHIIVGIRTNGGLSVYPSTSGNVHDLTIGTHQAKEDADNSGSSSCVIAIGMTTSSRIDIAATGDGITDPCPVAMTVANLVEPKLP